MTDKKYKTYKTDMSDVPNDLAYFKGEKIQIDWFKAKSQYKGDFTCTMGTKEEFDSDGGYGDGQIQKSIWTSWISTVFRLQSVPI